MIDMLNKLKLAKGIIENYRIDILNAIRSGKLPQGYCQGDIYMKGYEDIKNAIAKAEGK